jgi:hypothetical protein
MGRTIYMPILQTIVLLFCLVLNFIWLAFISLWAEKDEIKLQEDILIADIRDLFFISDDTRIHWGSALFEIILYSISIAVMIYLQDFCRVFPFPMRNC